MGGGSTAQSSVTKVSTLSVQTSAYGVAITRMWGTARITGNIIWYGDFMAVEQAAAGGKGGGGSAPAGYAYRTSVQMGLCDNPISGIVNVWQDKSKMAITGPLDFSVGSLTQTPWAYLTNKHPTEALAYPGLAWIGVANGNLGSSASLPNMSYEVVATSAGAGGTGDASSRVVIEDILRDVGYPLARVGGLDAYENYCFAYGLFLSPVIDRQSRAADHLDELLEMTCATAFWSEGKIKLVPFGDTAQTANGRTFTPAVTPIYALTDDDFLPVEGEIFPIRVIRKAPGDQKNSLRVEYKDRLQDYTSTPVEVQDDAHIAQFGSRPGDTRRYEAIKVGSIAQTVAWMQLQRGLYVLSTYEFKLGWRYCRLEPMDVVTLTHPGMQMDAVPVRILEIEDGPDGVFSIVAEDFVHGAGLAPLVQPPPAGGYSTNVNVAPGDAATPVLFEPPILLAGQPEVWIATSGGAHFGGCDVWVSLDNVTYEHAGSLAGKSCYGTASLAVGADPDNANTLTVDLTLSGGTLAGVTADDRDLLRSLCVVGGELLSFRDAALTAPGRYNLTSLRRGAYGTAAVAHASGTPFVRLDGQAFRYAVTPAMVGKTLYVKLQAYNEFGSAHQDIATLSPTAYVIEGAPPPDLVGYAGSVSADGTRVHVWETATPAASGSVVEIRYSASSAAAWVGMTLLGQAPYGAGRLEMQTPGAGTWTFEARLRDSFGAYSKTGSRVTVILGAPPAAAVAGVNRLYNSSASPTVPTSDGWAAWTNNAGGVDGTRIKTSFILSAWNSYALPSGSSRCINVAGAKDAALMVDGNSAPQPLPVMAGQRVEGHALTGAHRCTGLVLIVWTNSAGSWVGESWLGRNEHEQPGGINLVSWKKTGGFAVAPPGATRALLVIRLCEMVDADAYVFWDQAYLGFAGESQTELSPWSDGARPGAETIAGAQAKADQAATTATWTGVTGAGKPQDNATVGATFGVNISGKIDPGNSATYIDELAIGTSHLADRATTVVLQNWHNDYGSILGGQWQGVAVFDLLDEFAHGATITITSSGMLWPDGATDIHGRVIAHTGARSGSGLGLPWGPDQELISDFQVSSYTASDARPYSISKTIILAPGANLRVILQFSGATYFYLKHDTRMEVIKK